MLSSGLPRKGSTIWLSGGAANRHEIEFVLLLPSGRCCVFFTRRGQKRDRRTLRRAITVRWCWTRTNIMLQLLTIGLMHP